jgi:hypothetical protein
MPTDLTSAATQPPINEVARAAVVLPTDATLYSDTRFVAIAWDDPGDGSQPQASILGADGRTLPYLARFQLIDLLCGDRAMRAVDGTLQVCHRAVTPEAYLGLWRSALKVPLTPADLAERFGLTIVVTLGAALATARLVRSGWTTSPFAGFAEFEAAYGSRFVPGPTATGAPGFELTLDLREATAARDAFYGRAFVTDRSVTEGHVHMALAAIDVAVRALPSDGVQAGLFQETAP